MLLNLIKPVLLSLVLGLAFMLASVATNKAIANQETYNQALCALVLNFSDKPKKKQQTLKLNATVSMALTNAIALNNSYAARIATNVSCQQLTGASYTGSHVEWAKFFDSATQGLIKASYKELEFTLVGSDEINFKSALAQEFVAKEYDYIGTIGNNKQLIKNLALLDKKNNTLYTFSVSGNVMVESNVKLEFERLLASIKKISVNK
ncbi:MAG: hypothetical protein GY928_31690 [Colwellia sp.]|nr:hypothetical protein [Colwellia sp.]